MGVADAGPWENKLVVVELLLVLVALLDVVEEPIEELVVLDTADELVEEPIEELVVVLESTVELVDEVLEKLEDVKLVDVVEEDRTVVVVVLVELDPGIWLVVVGVSVVVGCTREVVVLTGVRVVDVVELGTPIGGPT